MIFFEKSKSDFFRAHEHHHSNYKLDLKLHIRNIQKEDYGQYKCLSKNSHGDNEGTIMLYGKKKQDWKHSF